MTSGAEALAMKDDSAALFTAIRAELLDEYRQNHDWPWIIGYSGGKDSTLVAHFFMSNGEQVSVMAEHLLCALPPSSLGSA